MWCLYYINLYSPRNGSNTKTQQYKDKYKQKARTKSIIIKWHIELKYKHNILYILYRTQLGRSIAKQLWLSFTASILPVFRIFAQRRLFMLFWFVWCDWLYFFFFPTVNCCLFGEIKINILRGRSLLSTIALSGPAVYSTTVSVRRNWI